MPLVHADRFSAFIERHYVKTDTEVNRPIAKMLNENPKFRKSIENYLTKMLQAAGAKSTLAAVLNRVPFVEIEINIEKQAQNFWGKLSPSAQQRISGEQIMISMELLLEMSNFEIEKHVLHHEVEIDAEVEESSPPEPETEPEPEIVIPQIEESSGMSFEEDDDEDDDENNEDGGEETGLSLTEDPPLVEPKPVAKPPAKKPAAKKPAAKKPAAKKPAAKKPNKAPTT